MKKSSYAEEQTAFELKQTETGTRIGRSAEKWVFLKLLFISIGYSILTVNGEFHTFSL